MAMDSQDFTTAGAAARLHLLEQKVKSLDPNTPPDPGAGATVTQRLDYLTAALNRCYEWAFLGAMNDNINYDNNNGNNDNLIEFARNADGNFFFFKNNDTNGDGWEDTRKNLVSTTFGGWDQLQHFKPVGANLFNSIFLGRKQRLEFSEVRLSGFRCADRHCISMLRFSGIGR